MEESSDSHGTEMEGFRDAENEGYGCSVISKRQRIDGDASLHGTAICKDCNAVVKGNMPMHVEVCPKRIPDFGSVAPLHFDEKVFLDKLCTTIIKHNYPFMFVQHQGNRDIFNYLCPELKHISTYAVKAAISKKFASAKEDLKLVLKSLRSKICLTSDLWTSITKDEYLVLTAHYVDEKWETQQKILNFRHMPSPHSGPILGEYVISLLKDWGIERKIFSLTLDDASYNVGLVEVLKSNMLLTGSLVCNGDFFHVPCGADVLNLIVQAGLKVIQECVHKVRESVKYIKGSEERKIQFARCIVKQGLESNMFFCNDWITRWFSDDSSFGTTFLMLDCAVQYQLVFNEFALVDTQYKDCPSNEEWDKIKRISKFLHPFFDLALLSLGSQYSTTNHYFHDVWQIESLIQNEMSNQDEDFRNMAKAMKSMFDKYWDRYSVVLSIAVVLDPRYKMQYIKFIFKKLYPISYKERTKKVHEKLDLIFKEYMSVSTSCAASLIGDNVVSGMDEFERYESEHFWANRNKSQLELYLDEKQLDHKGPLEILSYWEENRARYPNLSLLARDILSIPITSVASDSGFSIGGLILRKYRTTLLPKNVEALVCTRDWLYGMKVVDTGDTEKVDDIGIDFAPIIAKLDMPTMDDKMEWSSDSQDTDGYLASSSSKRRRIEEEDASWEERNLCKDCYTVKESGTENILMHAEVCPERTLAPPQFDERVFLDKLCTAIIKHNYPSEYAQHEGSRDVFSYLCPEVKHISTNDVKAAILKKFSSAKEDLKRVLKSLRSKICLTSNFWTSVTNDEYLVLTAHYVDENWELQKRILNFHHMPSPHSCPRLGEYVIKLLKDWGIEKKIFSLTLDNASYNMGLVEVLKSNMRLTGSLVCNGELFHVRCGADVFNLIVEAGLKVIQKCMHKVRNSVKYINGLEERKIQFARLIVKQGLEAYKWLCVDVATRYNSCYSTFVTTFSMLDSALTYRHVFDAFALVDTQYKDCPSNEEWEKITRIHRFLMPFNNFTILSSGSEFSTANCYFHNVWRIESLIQNEMSNRDEDIRNMAKAMKSMFDKYWDCYSVVLAMAVVLDPRYKMQYIEFVFKKLYPISYQERSKKLREKLDLIFKEYMSVCTSCETSLIGDNFVNKMDEFDRYESEHFWASRSKSQLELYLEEKRLDHKQSLEVLSYWEDNSVCYPNLSLLARDILSIPITSVAAESAFSIGGHILGNYRLSVLPKNVEALVCTRDWLYGMTDIGDEDFGEDFNMISFGSIIAKLDTTTMDN